MAAGALALSDHPIKLAQAMIDSISRTAAPKRLTLGSTAYTPIRAALLDRLAALDAQTDVALWTDGDG